MKNRKTELTTRKRRFAVLDREAAIKAAAGAINVLRSLSTVAPNATALRSGLGHALELVESELSDILLFSSSKRLSEDPAGEVVPISDDLGQARNAAAGAVKALRKILKDARADLSVEESQCVQLDRALDQVEEQLNKLLPPPGAPPKAKLPFDELEDEEGEMASAE